ncbi:MAG: DUF885 domain-containing protein [Elusimicrobiota bacterium]
MKILISFFLFVANIYSYEDSLSVESTNGRLEGARLDETIEKYIATITMYDPERATLIGVHDNDYLLTDREYNTNAKEIETLKLLQKDLTRIDKDSLGYERQTDYDLIYSLIEKDIYEFENLNILSTRPYYYIAPFDIVYFMMGKDFANYNLRAANAVKRLSQIPSVLYQAERNLTRPPRIWTEFTIKRVNLLIENIGDYYPLFRNYIGIDPTIKANFETIMQNLSVSLKRYKEYLEKELLPKSDGKAYTGLYTYGFYLERWHKISYNPRKALRIAKKNFNKNYKKLIEEAIKLNPAEYQRNRIKGVYATITGDFPKYDEVVKYISDQIENAKNHFDEYKVVNFPTQRLLIKNSPSFMQIAYPTVFYYPPYPLDRERVGELYISLPLEKSVGDMNLFLSQIYSQPKIEFFISGLIMPGLHLKSDSMRSVSKIRKIASQPAIEMGWMNYCEDLSGEMGYFSSVYTPFLVAYVKALRSLRAYIDVAFHIEEIDFEESSSFFTEYFGFDKQAADDEVVKISMNPTYYYAGIYGYNLISDLRKKYVRSENKFFDMREFHSDLLSRGNITISDLIKELKEIRKERIKKKIEEDEED